MGVQLPVRRRFTIVEAAVVLTLVTLLAVIAVPVLRSTGIDEAEAEARRLVQDAVRRYQFDTGAYPTSGPPPIVESTVVEPWQPGSLPSAASVPAFAPVDFEARAIKRPSGEEVRLYPNYLAELPKYINENAADGMPRWRINAQGDVFIELDGRSY